MKIVAIPDIHGDTKKIGALEKEITRADLVLLVGDITNFGKGEEILNIVNLFREINQNVLVVPGNCDQPEVNDTLDRENINLHGQFRVVEGIVLAGVGASLLTPYQATPYEVTEEYLRECLDRAMEGVPENLPMILVSHQPPIQTTADRLSEKLHVGSTSVRKFIEKRHPLICFCGHIHEGEGIDTIGNTKIVNPGPFFDGKYAFAEINQRIDTLEIRSIFAS